jgi:hypothetical protein
MTISKNGRGLVKATLLTGIAILASLFATASPATADTTHPYLGEMTLPPNADGPQPVGVDEDGNVLVWMESKQALLKFSPTGEPVKFSALDSHILDGKGGLLCGTVPADCDRVPSDGFNTAFTKGVTVGVLSHRPVGIDQSDGPASGHIYIQNESPRKGQDPAPSNAFTTIEVFDSSGKYLGQLDDSQAFPKGDSATYPASSLTVGPDGAIYLSYEFNVTGRCHVDRYFPLDADPASITFAGQLGLSHPFGLVSPPPNSIDENCTWIAAGADGFVYEKNFDEGWRKFPLSEFTRSRGAFEQSTPIDFSPDQCRCRPLGYAFGDGGIEPGAGRFEWLSVDPATSDAYIFNPANGHIEQWSIENKRIGPVFGSPAETEFYAKSMAFDTSGGPANGRIYLRGNNHNIAVYGPPVVVPDIENVESIPHHTSSTVTAEIGTSGGPQVESCEVEYGPTLSYGHSIPCSPAAPYAVDTHISTVLPGLVTEGDYYYRIVVTNANGTNKTEGFPTHPVAVLSLKTKPATDVTMQSATFHGELDGDGLPTEYRFEYGIDTNYRSSTPFTDIGSPAGIEPVPPVTLDSLQPGRKYHYRLVARNSLGVTYGNDQTVVAAAPPKINSLRAVDVTASTATLEATIDTVGYDSTYQFEYGTTTEYGSTAPTPAGALAAGDAASVVTVGLSDLLKGVPYHFRVSATNQWGTTVSDDTVFSFGPASCPNEHVRQQTGSTHLPDCRAYELVSPGDSAPLQLLPGDVVTDMDHVNGSAKPWRGIPAVNASGLASSPARFAFLGSMGSFPSLDVPNTILDRYVSTRTVDGWETTYPGLKGSEAIEAGRPQCDLAMSKCIDYRTGASAQYPGSTAPYVWDVSGKSLGRWPTNLAVVPGGDRPFNVKTSLSGDDKPSPDFSHYAFSSRDVAYAPSGLTEAPGSVYDNQIGDETVTIASKLPSGADIPLLGGTATEYLRIPAISNDGTNILISSVAFDGPTNLFMRADGAVTYEVSRGTGAIYVGMTADGDRVIFMSNNRLTPDDTDISTDLYMWRESDDSVIRLSKGNGQGDSDNCNAGWIGQCGVTPLTTERPDIDDVIASQSGDVFFFSPEQLDPENPGVLNERNLYVFHEGQVRYVTTFEPGTQINRSQISPDGTKSAFLTAARLTSYDNIGWRQLYTFSLDSGKIRCASCLPSGEPPTILHGSPTPSGDVMASQSGRFMSDDGRVVFATSDALVDRDTNRLVDVYEFVDGRPYLISSGTGQLDYFPGSYVHPDLFTGVEAISRDGVDIYFSTFDTLVSQDHIGSFIKFYDARTNGGFPPEPEFQPCVAADECHGPGNATPGGVQIGTGGELGAGGNAVEPRPAVKRKRKAQRKRAKRKARKAKRARGQRSIGRRG